MNELKKIIISFLIISVILVLIDICIGKLGDITVEQKFIENHDDIDCYRLNQCKEDILIIGSSRASRSFVPQILRDSINHYCQTDFSLFNVGVPGHYMECTCCAIESILNRYTPKLLIIEAGDNEVTDIRVYQQTLDYMDYYRLNPIVKSYIDRNLKNRVIAKCNMYRYNHKLGYVKNYILPNNNDSLFLNLGYQPLYTTMTETELDKNYVKKNNHFDTTHIKLLLNNFQDILLLCRNKNVNVLVVTSPSYKPIYQSQYIKSICIKNNIPYIDMMNIDVLSKDASNWYDVVHLSDKGARIFTTMFFEEIKPYLNLVS